MFKIILLSELLFILPLAVGMTRKKSSENPFPLVYRFIISVAILWTVGAIAERTIRNNFFTFYFYTLFQFIFYSFIFKKLLHINIKLYIIVFLSFAIIFILDTFYFNNITNSINSISNTYANTILVTFSIISLYKISNNLNYNMQREASFWFSIAVLFYTTTTTLLYIIANYHPSVRPTAFLTFPVINLIYMGLLTRMFLCFPLGIPPRRALPRWLRFRLGWRPPTKNWRYRVLPPHLVG